MGFASQRCVANLISGGLIFVTQPFKVGDLVATSTTTDPSSGGAFKGVVQRVGWHSTVLESVADGSVLIVPNSDVSTEPLRNLSRREKRVVSETVQLASDADRLRKIIFALNRVLRTHPGVLNGSPRAGAAAAATPRCVLVSKPDNGTLMARCTYIIDPSVPEVRVETL